MHDLGTLLEADSYRALLARLATVTEGTVRIVSDFGLQLNLAPGKTEAAVGWVGPGSRPVRRRLMSLSDNRHAAMLPLKTRLGDHGELQIPALSKNERAVRIVQACRHLGTVAQAGTGMGREIASRANTGQAATHASTPGQRGAPATRARPGGQGLRGYKVSAPGGDLGRPSGSPVAAVESRMGRTLANHCWGSSAAAPRSEMEVQRSGAEETEGRQVGGRARVYEAPLCCAGLQVGTGVCSGHAAVGGGHVPRRQRDGRSSRRLMVTRFAENPMEQNDGDEREGLSGSSAGEFLCPDGYGDDFPTLRRLKCHRGKAHGVRRLAARFVRGGVCPHCGVNFHCRARAMAHLERGARP